jgi:hypothetical protein
MEPIVLDNIPFVLDLDVLARRLHLTDAARRSEHEDDLRRLADEANAVARPKAMYRVVYIDDRGDDFVVIDGVTFASRILRVNLEHAHRVFLYVATCGTELAAWAHALDDLLHQYWAEQVQVMALGAASQAMRQDLVERFAPGKTSTMAPGSLGEWPLSQQRPLFASLDGVTEAIGVRLSDSMLMIPAKSVSGIRFPTEESFESCQLCPRENCSGRRAPYDSTLYGRKYRAT